MAIEPRPGDRIHMNGAFAPDWDGREGTVIGALSTNSAYTVLQLDDDPLGHFAAQRHEFDIIRPQPLTSASSWK